MYIWLFPWLIIGFKATPFFSHSSEAFDEFSQASLPWDEPQRAGVIGLSFSDNKNLNTRRVLPESEP